MKLHNPNPEFVNQLNKLFEQLQDPFNTTDIVSLFKTKLNIKLVKKSKEVYQGVYNTSHIPSTDVVVEKDFHNSRNYVYIVLCDIHDSASIDFDRVELMKKNFEQAFDCYNFKLVVRNEIFDTDIKNVICLSCAAVTEDD